MKTEKQINERIRELDREIVNWTEKRKDAQNVEQFSYAVSLIQEFTFELNTLNWILNK